MTRKGLQDQKTFAAEVSEDRSAAGPAQSASTCSAQDAAKMAPAPPYIPPLPLGAPGYGTASGGDFRGPAAACAACTACAARAARTRRLPVGMGQDAPAPCCHLLGPQTRPQPQPSARAPARLLCGRWHERAPSCLTEGLHVWFRFSWSGYCSVANGSSSVRARCRVVTGKLRWQ